MSWPQDDRDPSVAGVIAAVAGFGLGLSLIVAIGVQNVLGAAPLE